MGLARYASRPAFRRRQATSAGAAASGPRSRSRAPVTTDTPSRASRSCAWPRMFARRPGSARPYLARSCRGLYSPIGTIAAGQRG